MPLRTKGQNAFVGSTKAVEKLSGGKENGTDKMLVSQKYKGKENAAGGIVRIQTGLKQNTIQKVERRGLIGQKVHILVVNVVPKF